MIVPVQAPSCIPSAVRMFSRTTDEVSAEQVAPLRIAVPPRLPHVCAAGIGAGLVGVGESSFPPPHAARTASRQTTVTVRCSAIALNFCRAGSLASVLGSAHFPHRTAPPFELTPPPGPRQTAAAPTDKR